MTSPGVNERRINNIILKSVHDYIIINKLSGIPQSILDDNVSAFNKVMENIRGDIERLAEESEDLADFKTKVDGYIKVNPMNTEANGATLLDAVKSVSNVYDARIGTSKLGITSDLAREVVRNDSTLSMTNLGEDIQSMMRNSIEQGINQNKSMEFIRDEMNQNIDSLTKNRSEKIARTETAHAYNEAERIKAENSGKEYFIVVSTPTCCEDCFDAYDGNVFHLPEDEDMLPPFHPNCMCNAVFFKSESQAEDLSQEVSHDRPDLKGE